jgi:hypothetical protein
MRVYINGPKGVLWANNMTAKKITKNKIIGIIHHILLRQRKENKPLVVANLIFRP